MNFIILADKFQKRMKSKGCVGLININNKNIIQSQHKLIKKFFPLANIIYVYGFEGKKLLSFLKKNNNLANDIILLFNKHYEDFNNAYSLFLAKEYLDDDTFILFGDNILTNNIFDRFDHNLGSQIFISHKNKNRLGCIIQDNKIENICFDLDNYLYEIYYFSKKDIGLLKHLVDNEQNHNNFLFELLNKLIDKDIDIKPFFTDRIRVNNEK